MVESTGRVRSGDQHQKDQSGTVETVGFGRGDARARREDDVRPAPEGNGSAHIRGTKETRHAQKVHVKCKLRFIIN